MPRTKKPPRLCLHKATGQGRVILDGRHVYLGKFGTPECKVAYDEIVRKWSLRQADPAAITVDVLSLRYLEHADGYYRRRDRTPTRTAQNVRDALKPLVALHGRKLVRAVTPADLKAVVNRLIGEGLARTTINGRLSKIKSMFKWAVAEGLCPVVIWQGLTAVSGLRAGRTEARETEPVKPVPVEVVEATLPHLPRPVAGAVRFQLHTGCRPSEALVLRACDLDTTGDVWLYRPHEHKLEHHGRDRVIPIGPRGQELVREFLTTDLDAYLFSPRLASKRGGDRYSRQTYLHAIIRGCQYAFDMPAELRGHRPHGPGHEGRDRRRAKGRAEAAESRGSGVARASLLVPPATAAHVRDGDPQAVRARSRAGDPRSRVTQVYAERDLAKAREVAAAIG